MDQRLRLAVFTTHPIQYQVPLWRNLVADPALNLRVYFGSDFSVRGYVDREFSIRFAWDVPLIDGYAHEFLTPDPTVQDASHIRLNLAQVRARIQHFAPHAALLCGYAPFRFYLRIIQLLLRRRVPLLLRGEVTDENSARPLAKRLIRAAFLRMLYRQFNGLLAIGENARRHYLAKGVPESRIFWSPYSVDTDWFEQQAQYWGPRRETARQALGFAPGQPVFIFCGKLIPRKDPLMLPAALHLLAEQGGMSPGLIVLGDGELHGALQAALTCAPTVQAVFAGFQNQSELGKYYAAADCLILPSWYETWGLVVNEALQFGKPAIVSDRVGCWPDLITVGETGFVFPAGDVLALAACMRQMITLLARSREKLSAACRQKVAEYSTDQAVAGIRAAVLNLI